MKILVYSDNHWCQYSSIVRTRSDKYSVRLDNQIKSINWAEDLSNKLNCDMVVHCGDFFDKESLNSMEITALQELRFSDCTHILIVGNHEMGINSLEYSSAHIFELIDTFNIIDKPVTMELDDFHQLCFLPYTLGSSSIDIGSVFPTTPKKRIIFSHNDIAGIQLGKFITKDGLSIDNIEQNCDLFINGHIHNGQRITNKIFNIGNLTGQNFSEDAFTYSHSVFVIDTSTLRISVFDNPYAFNFYKIDFTEDNSIEYINKISSKLKNAVVTIKCNEDDYEYLSKRFGKEVDDVVPHHSSIIESKFIIQHSTSLSEEELTDLSVDHLNEFRTYVINEFGSTDIVLQELEELFK